MGSNPVGDKISVLEAEHGRCIAKCTTPYSGQTKNKKKIESTEEL